MFKTIIKEIIIVILLLFAIALILGVLLYDYMPINKVVPVIEQYQTSEEVKTELEENIDTESSEVVVTYEMDSSDLNLYEKNNEYDKGKVNPFSVYTPEPEPDTTNTENNNTDNNNTNSNTNTSGNNTTQNSTSSNSTFFNDTGTK